MRGSTDAWSAKPGANPRSAAPGRTAPPRIPPTTSGWGRCSKTGNNLAMGTLSAAAVVEEFIDQWHRSDLRDKMREPMATDNLGVVELTAIAVYGPHQGKGYAGRAMRMLTALCDTNGLTIKLIARPLPLNIVPGCPASLSTDQLVAWYGRYGFVDAIVPGDDTRTMVRRPTQK